MTWLIALVTGWGVPKRFAMPVIIFAGIALATGLFFGAKALYDHSVIEKHDAKVELDQAKQDSKANDKAAVQRREDDQRAAQENQELKNVLTDKKADPLEQRARFYRCIELQRRARQNGLEPPTCS